MFAGSRIAVVLTFAVGAAVQAQSFEYAPGTATYRVTQTTKGAQEAMGQKNEIEGTTSQVLTISLAKSAKDTVLMDVTLDSISTSIGMPQMLDRFVGLKVSAKLSPVGKVYSTQAGNDKGGAEAEPLQQVLGGFLPKLSATLRKGAAWADTSAARINQGGMEVERKTVSNYRVDGDTTIAGQTAWKIAKVDSVSMSGSGNTANGPMTMEGTSTSNGTLFVSSKGVYFGGEGTEESKVRIVVAANGMEIGVTQNSTTRVEKVK